MGVSRFFRMQRTFRESNRRRLLLAGFGHRPLDPEGVAALVLEPLLWDAEAQQFFVDATHRAQRSPKRMVSGCWSGGGASASILPHASIFGFLGSILRKAIKSFSM
jgi:hypothetical protein